MSATDWQKYRWEADPGDDSRPIVRVRVLGGFRAQYRESIWELGPTSRDIPGTGQREWEYFALLAGWPGESVHTDLVASALWPGTTVEHRSMRQRRLLAEYTELLAEHWQRLVPGFPEDGVSIDASDMCQLHRPTFVTDVQVMHNYVKVARSAEQRARSALERHAKAEGEAETQTALRMWAAVERFGVAELLTTADGPVYPWVAAPLERDGRVLRDLVNSFVQEAEHRLAGGRRISLGSQHFVLSA